MKNPKKILKALKRLPVVRAQDIDNGLPLRGLAEVDFPNGWAPAYVVGRESGKDGRIVCGNRFNPEDGSVFDTDRSTYTVVSPEEVVRYWPEKKG